MKRKFEASVKGPNSFWANQVRIAVFLAFLTMVVPEVAKSRVAQECRDIVVTAYSAAASALTSVIQRGRECIFGDDRNGYDMEMDQRTVKWPL
jgi:hypothetical protein